MLVNALKNFVSYINSKNAGVNALKKIIGRVVDWLKRRAHNQLVLGSKPTRAILLCPWERRFTPLSPAWCPGKQF